MENHRIKAKIGPYEFDAEGDRDLVSKQYDQFLALITALPKEAAQSLKNTDPERPPPGNGIDLPRDVLSRVFRDDEPFSLLAKPKSDNVDTDGLIVLMYGMGALKGETHVTGSALMKSAKQSGLRLKADRVDRTIDEYVGKFVNAAGNKRGLRYSLNNEGIKHAIRLINEMV